MTTICPYCGKYFSISELHPKCCSAICEHALYYGEYEIERKKEWGISDDVNQRKADVVKQI